MRALWIALVLAAGISAPSFVPGAEAQCAMCRTALESSEEGRAMAVKLNQGILLLLGAPITTAAAIAAALLRSRRRLGAARGGEP